MEWEYLIEEVSDSEETNSEMLQEAGSGEWEAVASWAVPGDTHVNQGAWKVYILFKKPKKI
jgi:hypothetical protein